MAAEPIIPFSWLELAVTMRVALSLLRVLFLGVMLNETLALRPPGTSLRGESVNLLLSRDYPTHLAVNCRGGVSLDPSMKNLTLVIVLCRGLVKDAVTFTVLFAARVAESPDRATMSHDQCTLH